MGEKLNTADSSSNRENDHATIMASDSVEHTSADPRLAELDHLRHTERAIAVERLAAYVAHELGTPLNVIEARAQMLGAGDATSAEVQKHAKSIADQASRMTKMLTEVLALTRPSPSMKARVDLLSIAKRALASGSVSGERAGVRVSLDPSSTAAVTLGFEDRLLQVAMNLVVNGVEATPRGGTVTLATRLTRRRPLYEFSEGALAEFATLEVRDEGPGISQESLPLLSKPEAIWKAFFLTKPESRGSGKGMGLSIAQSIVRDHGGWIEVESGVGQGSCFTVYLPRGDG